RYHPGFAAALRFLTESSRARDVERAEQLEHSRRELAAEQEKAEAQARYARRMRWAAVFSGALAVAAIGAGVVAFRAKQDAEIQAKRADRELMKAQMLQSQSLASRAQERQKTGDGGTALALAIEALPDEAAEPPRLAYVPGTEDELDDALRSLRE